MDDAIERERVAALSRYEILDTPPEPLFDSLTQLAAKSFGVPIASITLVDQERQWFKSCVGIDIRQTPRSLSFCQHTILDDEVFVVLDARRDARFCDNPFVTASSGVRFYAGAPLITPDGHRLGAFCIVDTAPRTQFMEAEAAQLKAISHSVMQALLMRLESRQRARIAAIADERYKLLSLAEQMAGVGTWSWDIATDRTSWSDEVYRIHGLQPGSETPDLEGALASYHPDDAKMLAAEVERAVREGVDYEIESRMYRIDGSQRYVAARGAPRRGPDGTVTGLFGTFQDVTRHVESERFIRALTDHLPGMVGYWDSELRCRFANPTYLEWFGRTPEQILGMNMADLLGEKLFAQNATSIRAVLRGEPQTFQNAVIKPSGQLGHVLVRYIPDFDKSGRVMGLYVMATDVTDLKQAEEKLTTANALMREARDQAIAASNVKAEFLANMSHEIRTPLTAILGFAGLLSVRDDLNETARAQLGRIQGASATLLSIVNDILDFSKLEAGQIVITPRPVNVVDLARDTLTMFSPQAEAKALSLQFEAAQNLPGHVLVDPDRLRQILLNLIGNAVKFTDQGGIGVALSYRYESETLSVRVTDTGCGLSEAQQALLFQRFSQVDASLTRRHGGAGLGLAICRGLAEAMGGQVGVQSEPGRGSVFHVTIHAPAAEVAGGDADDHRADGALRGVRVLIADEDLANRELLRVVLVEAEADVTFAVDGAQAAASAMEAPFDVVLVDLDRSVPDGLGVLRRIRSEPGPNQDTPVFALTAQADCESYGGLFDCVIGKPIDAAALIAALARETAWPSPLDDAQADRAVSL